MNIFLLIPDSVIVSIIECWLELSDIANLDSAHCERKSRDLFLHTLSSITLLCKNEFEHNKTSLRPNYDKIFVLDCFLPWVNKRNVFLKSLYLTAELQSNVSFRKELLSKIGSRILKVLCNYYLHGALCKEALKDISSLCANLESLDFTDFGTHSSHDGKPKNIIFDHACLVPIISSCTSLITLNMNDLRINDSGLLEIMKSCTRLRHLYIRDRVQLTTTGLITTAKYMNQLETIEIGRSYNEHIAVHQDIYKVLICTPKLHTLHIPQYTLNSYTIQNMIFLCPLLQSLHFNTTVHISESILQEFLQYHRMLEDLRFNNTGQLSDNIIHTIYTYCKNIHTLYISQCTTTTDQSLLTLLNKLAHLRNLDLTGYGFTNQETIIEIAKLPLTTLRLKQCSRLSYKIFPKFCQYLTKILILSLEDCNINDTGLYAISTYCLQLQHLNIAYCYEITDLGIISIAENNTELCVINMRGCMEVTIEGVQAFVKHEKLRHLTVSLSCIIPVGLFKPRVEVVVELVEGVAGYSSDGDSDYT